MFAKQVLVDECTAAPPVVDLDGKLYKMVDGMEKLTPEAPPSLKKCKKIKVTGPVIFAAGTVLTGEVEIVNNGKEPKQVKGNVSGKVDL